MDIVIVGAGWMGGVHAEAARRAGDRVVGVVDPDGDRAAALATEAGARVWPDLEAALGEGGFDAAVVTTPSRSHLDDATRLVEAGTHVLVEKPHRLPDQDATPLREALAARPEVRLQVGMSNRFKSGIRETVEAVADGGLGEVVAWQDRTLYQLEQDSLSPWYFNSRVSGGGVSVTNGVHAIDRVRWCLGEVTGWQMRAHRVFPEHEGEDLAHITATTPAGADISLLLVWSDWELPPSELLVVGSRGTAVVRSGTGWSVTTADRSLTGEEESPAARFDRQWRAFQRHVLEGEPVASFAEVDPVLDVIAGLAAPQRGQT